MPLIVTERIIQIGKNASSLVILRHIQPNIVFFLYFCIHFYAIMLWNNLKSN